MKKTIILPMLITILAATLIGFHQVTPAGAINWVQGHIVTDTIWTPNDTYRVIGDTYIDPGTTLTITSGVRIELADGFSLIVEGNLNATGTPTQPIVFTSSRTQPIPGAWQDIEFSGNASAQFKLENAQIVYATTGVIINSIGQATIVQDQFMNNSQAGILIRGDTNTTITNCTINANGNGITSDDAAGSNLQITGNSISQNLGEGIYIQAQGTNYSRVHDLTITNNAVTNNSGNGINLYSLAETYDPQLYHSYAYLENVTVAENQVALNGQDGIHVVAEGHSKEHLADARHGYAYINDLNVTDNSASSNKGNGIYLLSEGHGFYGESIGTIQNSWVLSNNGTGNGKNGLEIVPEGIAEGSYASGGSAVMQNVTVANNTLSFNQQDGIQLSCQGQADIISTTSITGLNIENNKASSNAGNGISLLANSQGSRGEDASINQTAILTNDAAHNGQNGFFIQPQTRAQAYVQNILIQDDKAYLNQQNGIAIIPISTRFLIENVDIKNMTSILNQENGIIITHIRAQASDFPVPAYFEGFVNNVTVENSIASQNGERGISIEPDPTLYNSDPTFNRYNNGGFQDITIANNTVIANDVGIFICPTRPSNSVQTENIINNSIRLNNQGIEITDEQNTTAHNNDIFQNSHGMNITETATASAENNYWGNDSGPYHASVNPTGTGDSVNGNGVNLKFIPFLTRPALNIDTNPIAVLTTKNNTVYVNDTVTFDASNSTISGPIQFWRYDFGNGNHTDWTAAKTINYSYLSPGTYDVTLTVMDSKGLTSQNTIQVQVQTKTVPEIPSSTTLLLLVAVITLAFGVLRKRKTEYDLKHI